MEIYSLFTCKTENSVICTGSSYVSKNVGFLERTGRLEGVNINGNIYRMDKSIPSDFHGPLLDYEKHDMGAVVFDAYYMNSDKIKSDLNIFASHAKMFLK